MGVSALLNVLLPADASKPADPDAFLTQALGGANPDMLMKIKEAEQTFKLDMQRLDIDLKKFLIENESKDMAGARDLKVQWLKSDKWDYEPMLACVVVTAFLGSEAWAFYYAGLTTTMEPNQAVLVGRVLGTIDAAFMLLLNFRWSSSRSSERKTEIAAAASQAVISKMPSPD